MPKRSNEFQELMHHIYTQMASRDAEVTESALLKERNRDSEREVDILIEDEVAGVKVRIAVECRDRERKDTVEWIDALIGKYRDLDVQKVVAVSRSGFSQEAIAKASANGIDTRTLEEALETDWPEEFAKLAIVKLTYQPLLQGVWVETQPELRGEEEVSGTITDGKGKVCGTLEEVALDCFRAKVQVDVREYISSHFLDLFETLGDLKGKGLVYETSVSKPDLHLIDPEAAHRKVLSLIFRVIVTFTTESRNVQRYVYDNKAQVTAGSVHFEGSDTAYSVDIVQLTGKEQARVFFRPVNGAKK
jgi:hypothetical protein